MSSIDSLGYIGLEVSDVNKWIDYLTNVLGLQYAGANAVDEHIFRMDDYAARIYLREGPADDIVFAGWEVNKKADFEALMHRLDAEGIDVTEAIEEKRDIRRVSCLFTIKDPNGLELQIYHGPTVDNHDPFRSPRSISGFKAADLGVGHIVLSTPDLEMSRAFYEGLLGFKVSDYIKLFPLKDEIIFMRCNPRHHSLAFAHVPSPKRLEHFMIEMLGVDDVMSTFEMVEKGDIRLASDMGRHSNDKMFSFYMESPSGFEIGCGCDGLVVDDASWNIRRYDKGSVWGHNLRESRIEKIKSFKEG